MQSKGRIKLGRRSSLVNEVQESNLHLCEGSTAASLILPSFILTLSYSRMAPMDPDIRVCR